jgi:hypothetical protein
MDDDCTNTSLLNLLPHFESNEPMNVIEAYLAIHHQYHHCHSVYGMNVIEAY